MDIMRLSGFFETASNRTPAFIDPSNADQVTVSGYPSKNWTTSLVTYRCRITMSDLGDERNTVCTTASDVDWVSTSTSRQDGYSRDEVSV